MADKQPDKQKLIGIPEWCLDVAVAYPSAEEIESVATLLKTNHDVARIPDVATFAAFSLVARYPATGSRHFGNDEIPLLSRRNLKPIRRVLDAIPDTASELIALFTADETPTPTPTKSKPSTKRKKSP